MRLSLCNLHGPPYAAFGGIKGRSRPGPQVRSETVFSCARSAHEHGACRAFVLRSFGKLLKNLIDNLLDRHMANATSVSIGQPGIHPSKSALGWAETLISSHVTQRL